MPSFVNAIAGLLFGLGLLLSGMADPAKVQNFLDLFGAWDASLAFVMAGAVATTFMGYRLAMRRPAPLLSPKFAARSSRPLDRPLLIGAGIFGVGWGLTGFCPGPAVVSLPLLARGTLLFVPAMLAGIVVARLMARRRLAAA